jgi:hypothetical protein
VSQSAAHKEGERVDGGEGPEAGFRLNLAMTSPSLTPDSAGVPESAGTFPSAARDLAGTKYSTQVVRFRHTPHSGTPLVDSPVQIYALC